MTDANLSYQMAGGLLPGESLQVKYRLLPAGMWQTLSPYPVSLSFTIPNLEDGCYQVQAAKVKSGGQVCPTFSDHQFCIGAQNCCLPALINATSIVSAVSYYRLLRFNNQTENVLRVWVHLPTSGAPDVEIGPGETYTVTITDANFVYQTEYIDVAGNGYPHAFTREDGPGGRSLVFDPAVGFPNLASPENSNVLVENELFELSAEVLATGDPLTVLYFIVFA